MKPQGCPLESLSEDESASGLGRMLWRFPTSRVATARLFSRAVPAIGSILDKEGGVASLQPLMRVIEDLEALNRDTEQDCVKLGEELRALIDSVQDVRSGLESLNELMSGESADRTEAALAQALSHSLAATACCNDDSSKVSKMRRSLAPLKLELAGFGSTITTFRSIAMLTRIETSRLADAGLEFSSLANELTSLAASLEETVQSSLDMADSLIAPIDRALADLGLIETDQAENLPALIQDVSAQLSAFKLKLRNTKALSSKLGARYDDITASFRQVVVSLQVHDITRQRLEHVIQTLRSLIKRPGRPEAHHAVLRSRLRKTANEDRAFASILDLQSLQLEHAGSRFASAVSAIAKSLAKVAEHVREISEESLGLLNLSENEGQDMVEGVGNGFVTVLAGLQRFGKAASANARAESFLLAAIESMRKPIHDIQRSELQILRLSMNASICAARVGYAGDCLGVLAVSVQKLALDSKERSDFIMESLDSASAARIGSVDGEPSANPKSADPAQVFEMPAEWLNELREGITDLQQSSSKSWEVLTGVVASGTRISEELEATCRRLCFGAVFAESMGRIRDAIAQISTTVRDRGTPFDLKQHAGDLAGIETFYTMQCERDVHEAFLAGNAGLLCTLRFNRGDEACDSAISDVELF